MKDHQTLSLRISLLLEPGFWAAAGLRWGPSGPTTGPRRLAAGDPVPTEALTMQGLLQLGPEKHAGFGFP